MRTIAAAIKQRDAQRLLKFLDPKRDRGLRDVQTFRSSTKTAEFVYGDKGLEMGYRQHARLFPAIGLSLSNGRFCNAATSYSEHSSRAAVTNLKRTLSSRPCTRCRSASFTPGLRMCRSLVGDVDPIKVPLWHDAPWTHG